MIYRAKIIDIHPAEYMVSVLFANLSQLGGVRVHLGGQWAQPLAGRFEMPELHDWGLVACYTDDPRDSVWIYSFTDRGNNLIPTELLTADQFATLEHHAGDEYTIQHGNGSRETVWADGTLLRVQTTKDGTAGNPTKRGAKTPRFKSSSAGQGQEITRKAWTPHTPRPPVDVVLKHSSGAEVRISADGSFHLETPKGHKLRLFDSAEKARSPTTDAVTSTVDASRTLSEITLESEIGHKVVLHDDPLNAADRFISIRSSGGHELKMIDKPDADQRITAKTAAGHQLELRDTPAGNQYAWIKTAAGNVVEARDTPAASLGVKAQTVAGFKLELLDTPKTAKLSTPGGRSTLHDDTAALTTITDPVKVLISSPLVALADGGPAVARVGDKVMVNGIVGSIISGSSKTTSG